MPLALHETGTVSSAVRLFHRECGTVDSLQYLVWLRDLGQHGRNAHVSVQGSHAINRDALPSFK